MATYHRNGFRTLTARYAGTCKRCGNDFPAGTTVRWAKGAGSYHLATDAACAAAATVATGDGTVAATVVATVTAPTAVAAGFYCDDATVYEVKIGRSGRAYVKRLNVATGGWDYLGRAPLRWLTDEHALTVEKAQAFGKRFGRCARCGLLLTADDSLERMMGPVCFKRMTGMTFAAYRKHEAAEAAAAAVVQSEYADAEAELLAGLA